MVLQIHPQSSFENKTSWRIQLGKLSLLARPTQDQILKWIFLAGERQSAYKHHNSKEHLFELGEHLFTHIFACGQVNSWNGYLHYHPWEVIFHMITVPGCESWLPESWWSKQNFNPKKKNSSNLQPFAWYHHLKHIACLCTFGYTYANVCGSNLHSKFF